MDRDDLMKGASLIASALDTCAFGPVDRPWLTAPLVGGDADDDAGQVQSNLTGKDLTCARKGTRFARLVVSSVTDGRIANYPESKLHLEVNHLSPVDGDTRPPRRGLRLMKKRGIGGEEAG